MWVGTSVFTVMFNRRYNFKILHTPDLTHNNNNRQLTLRLWFFFGIWCHVIANLLHWRWKQQVSPECGHLSTRICDITSWKTTVLIFIDVRTSNLRLLNVLPILFSTDSEHHFSREELNDCVPATHWPYYVLHEGSPSFIIQIVNVWYSSSAPIARHYFSLSQTFLDEVTHTIQEQIKSLGNIYWNRLFNVKMYIYLNVNFANKPQF
jgi:hypothetical protein